MMLKGKVQSFDVLDEDKANRHIVLGLSSLHTVESAILLSDPN